MDVYILKHDGWRSWSQLSTQENLENWEKEGKEIQEERNNAEKLKQGNIRGQEEGSKFIREKNKGKKE